jgi:hypothetical protein
MSVVFIKVQQNMYICSNTNDEEYTGEYMFAKYRKCTLECVCVCVCVCVRAHAPHETVVWSGILGTDVLPLVVISKTLYLTLHLGRHKHENF